MTKLSKTQRALLKLLDVDGCVVRLGGGTWTTAAIATEAGVTDQQRTPSREQYDLFRERGAQFSVQTLYALAERGVLEQHGDEPVWCRPYRLTELGRQLKIDAT